MSNSKNEKKIPCVKWSAGDITRFLEVYNSNYELLWNIRHGDYANKSKRESALGRLKNELIGKGIAVPDLAFLRARIKAIKSTYRAELLKVIESMKSGAGIDDVYAPKLPWYAVADVFMRDVLITRKSASHLDSSKLGNNSEENEDAIGTFENSMLPTHIDGKVPESPSSQGSKRSASMMQPPLYPPKYPKKNMPTWFEKSLSQLQTIAEMTSVETDDQYEKFGKHVASQLREMPLRSFIILQGKIQDLITTERLNVVDSIASPLRYFAGTPNSSGSDH